MHRDYLQNNLSEPTPGFKKRKAFIPTNKAFCDEIKITAYLCMFVAHIFLNWINLLRLAQILIYCHDDLLKCTTLFATRIFDVFVKKKYRRVNFMAFQ